MKKANDELLVEKVQNKPLLKEVFDSQKAYLKNAF